MKTEGARAEMKGKRVLVTTVNRGVFVGTLVSEAGDTCVLRNARNCIYWSAATKGFLGLAANGPAAGSRIGPAVPLLSLRNVTSIALVTAQAAKVWESVQWSS